MSGAEKSRQHKHDEGTGWEGGCDCAASFGLLARSFDRSGLEDQGSGGGPPVKASVPSVLLFPPLVVLISSELFIPNDSADRAGTAGGLSGGSLLVAPADSFRTDVCRGWCGGRDGRVGGLSTFFVVTLGDGLVGIRPILDLSMSWYLLSTCSGVRFGGRGGKVDWSKMGASFLPASIEGVREPGVLAVPLVPTEIADIVEMVEEMDSDDSLRCKAAEDLLGGKAGEG